MIRIQRHVFRIRIGATAAAIALLLSASLTLGQQPQTPTQQPGQLPKTSKQVTQALPTYEGQTVTSVELAGRPGLNTDQLMPLLKQKENQPFSQASIEQSIAALKKTGQFQDVRLQVLPEPSGVRVLLVLEPAVYIGIYEFPGAGRFPYSRLLQIASYPPRGPFTNYEVNHAREELEQFFKRTGYFLAEVHPEVQNDKQHGIANIIFHVQLGKKANFGQVKFENVDQQQAARLDRSMHSLWSWLHGADIKTGKGYKLKTVQKAGQYLENTLTGNGHLAAQVHPAGAQYHPETNRADVIFRVNPGPKTQVKVQGAHLWSWTRHRLLPIYQQIGVNPELIQEGRQNLISYFESKGYFDVKVATNVQTQPSGESIAYQITKGPRNKVGEVSITGNKHVPTAQLMPQVTVQEAKFWFFSHGKYSQQLVRKTISNLTSVYEANGFSDVSITPEVKNKEGNLDVTFRINEGPQDVVAGLHLEGNDTVPQSTLAPKGLNLKPGQPYSQQAANLDRNQIMARYFDLGYLRASFRETVQTVNNNPHRLQVVYHIDEGPRIQISSVFILGDEKTKQRFIDRNLTGLKPGDPLRENSMLTSETNLYTPNIFDWAEIDPRRPVTTQTKEDVVVKVHEAKRNSISYGGGFEVINRGGSVPSGTVAVPGLPPIGLPSTFKTSEKRFWGPRGTFEYTRKNLFGKAESLTLAGLAGRLIQRGNFVYTDPNFRWTNWTSNFSITGEHNSENPIFTYREGQAGLQFERPLNKDKTTNLFLRYSFSETGITNLLIPDLVPPEDRHVRLSTLSSSYIRDTRDSVLDAHKGIYESFQLDFNPSALGSNFNFTRLLAQTAYYKKIPLSIIWANSLRIGLEEPLSGHVPLSEKFFSGGGSTLRGFPLNGAGPQQQIPACGNPADPSTCSLITVPVGGNELLIVNSEFRIPLSVINKNLGVVTFYDGGNVFPVVGFHGQYTNTVGIGLRYSTPVGPIRFDIGHRLTNVPGISATQFFVTLGQAF